MEFGENLRQLRESLGITQADLSERLGVTRGLIAQYENGAKSPNVILAARIAKELGTTLDSMMQRKEGDGDGS